MVQSSGKAFMLHHGVFRTWQHVSTKEETCFVRFYFFRSLSFMTKFVKHRKKCRSVIQPMDSVKPRQILGLFYLLELKNVVY